MQQQNESVLIDIRRADIGKDNKGRDKVKMYFTPEAAETLAKLILESNGERGVNFQVHLSEDTYTTESGNSFNKTSGFGFVNTTQKPGQNFQGRGQFVTKQGRGTGMTASIRSKAASTLNTKVD